MPPVKPEQIKEARLYLERLRFERSPGLGFTDPEFALLAYGNALDDLLASCKEMSTLVEAMADSKKIDFNDAQRAAMKERYGRAMLAIANAEGRT